MKPADLARKLLAACVIGGFAVPVQSSTAFAQEYGLVGTWSTAIGSPSGYGSPGSSVVFTTTFAPGGTYRTIAFVEGGDGYSGAGGSFIMTGHYDFQAPSILRYRMENSMLCVAGGYCSPSIPPGEQLGVVVSVNLQFNGSGGFLANSQPWTRLQ
jgi:hypothetical protein